MLKPIERVQEFSLSHSPELCLLVRVARGRGDARPVVVTAQVLGSECMIAVTMPTCITRDKYAVVGNKHDFLLQTEPVCENPELGVFCPFQSLPVPVPPSCCPFAGDTKLSFLLCFSSLQNWLFKAEE